MKILMWIIVAIVIVGGLFWFFSSPETADSSNNTGSETNQANSADTLSENGRVIDTDDKVFEEIDEALSSLS